jgi:glycosyltransferase involved in cell wall biosynthesis
MQLDEPLDEEDADEEQPAAAGSDEWDKPHLTGRGMTFRRRHRLDGKLGIYAGVTTPRHGCPELIEYFDAYAGSGGEGSLVLLGVRLMKVPPAPYLRLAGVLPIRDRMAAYEASDVTFAPDSEDVSSESVLESFAAGTPVLAPAANAAAVDHCRKSGGGLFYANRDEFVATLTRLMQDDALRTKLGENGRRYVRQHYNWEAVIGRMERLLTRVRAR